MNALLDVLPEAAQPGEDVAALEDAFDRLLAGSSRLAFRVAYSVLRQREDSEDVAQEALARCYRTRQSLRDPARFQAWLVRTCWRMALNHRRAAQRRENREQRALPTSPPPGVEEIAAASESRDRLWRAIDGLPEKLRLVLVLSSIEGHDTRDVAHLAGLPEGTVKSRLHLARQRLSEALR